MKFNIVLILFLITPKCSPTLFGTDFILNFFKSRVFQLINSNINGTECATDLNLLVHSVFDLDWWAISMLDASSKMNSGLLRGNRRMLGNYDQCISLEKAQYCVVPVVPDRSVREYLYKNIFHEINPQNKTTNQDILSNYMIMHYGLCIPQSCTTSDLSKLWKSLKKSYNLPGKAEFSDDLCYSKNKGINTTNTDIYVFFFFFVVVTVELTSTIYDLHSRQKGKHPNIFVSFSLYTNTKKLLSIHCENSSLKCLYGIRVLGIVWVILAHMLIGKSTHCVNSLDVLSDWTKRYEHSIFIAAPYAVDTFLAISGLLVVYVGLKFEFHWTLFYLHRIVRLGPALLATVLINLSFVKYLIDGPFAFNTLRVLHTNCQNSFWYTVFFVSNFVPEDYRCMPHSWYLGIDTQLYLLAPTLIYWIRHKKSKFLLLIGAVCVFSFIYTWCYVLNNNSGFMYFFERVDDIYTNPICRMPAWLVGIYFGYLLHKHRLQKTEIPYIINVSLWLACLCIMTTLILYQVYILRHDYNVYRSAFFNTFSRPLWSASVCYIIFSCCTGHARPVNTFLSHPVFIVLGKLSYSMYLIHITTTYVVVTNKRQVGYFSTFEFFFDFWGHFVCVLVGAVVLCLLFEAPVVSFLRHLQARRRTKMH
ncbi:hypothetical protein Zmor_016244 [Zophobas morio]|uniref:Nose resistant-to-fluoxetine protein N-terminal domain-containing protein n=1 Tax=Zophobas morio TaxID=2755281 RepID=A0AA38ILC9_9CUCU|nr:hypothetical protein Zmor_016244 [Zophobas morio]